MTNTQIQNLPSGLSYVEIYTLVDISTTGTIGKYRIDQKPQTNLLNIPLIDEPTWKKSRNQQRNWETAVQIIGLRAQPLYLENSVILLDQDLTNYSFGSNFSGKQTIWTLLFGVEQHNIYDKNGIELQSLVEDFNGVPVTAFLNETFKPPSPTVITVGPSLNTYFRII